MIPNHSPWIKQLNRKREVYPIDRDLKTNVAIVGGGIAGVSTAYFILENTDKKVVLVEADKIAHGATGHNAGQLTSYFERPLADLVEEFGLKMAIDGQRSVESAWILLDEIFTKAKLQTPIYKFNGYAGFSTSDQVLLHLRNNFFRAKGNLPVEDFFIAEEWDFLKKIPQEYKSFYLTVPQNNLLGLLETDSKNFIAASSYPKGCLNSALFCEELLAYLIANHKNRFSFYEGSPVKKINLKLDKANLEILNKNLEAEKIVLCTNGFSNFSITNEGGPEIDTKFHHLIHGRIGYMAGYVEPLDNPPAAVSYFSKNNQLNHDPTGETYFYMTRRPHEQDRGRPFNLVSAGGPEKVLPNGALYSKEDACTEEVKIVIDDFLKENYARYPGEAEYGFCWHGLMGYTPNGIRRIGPEPCNPILLYNLGCNGVGILPSIYGGKKISDFIFGKLMEKSIFDPNDQRCEVSAPASTAS